MGLGIRDMLSRSPGAGGISPPWWSSSGPTDPSVGGRIMYLCGLACDAVLEKMEEAVFARFPRYAHPSAIPYLSLDRLISQGPSESADAFAMRLEQWLDSWRIAGSPRSVMQQLRGYFSPFAPLTRTVDRTSNWFSYTSAEDPATASPSMRHGAANWTWDTVPTLAQPDYAFGWWNFWTVIQSVAPNAWCSPAPKWGTAGVKWGKANGMSWGFSQPSSLFQGIRTIVRGLSAPGKAAHSWCRWIIVSFDSTLFDPAQASGGVNPDATWGDWGKVVAGTFVAARSASARYIEGVHL